MDKFEYNEIDWKVPIERSLLINPNIDNAAMRLYLILLSYARDKITAFPSRETLAKDMNCGIRNIDLIKKKLKKLGLLDWKYQFNGKNKYNVYTLLQYKPIKKKEYIQQEKIELEEDLKPIAEEFSNSYQSFCEKYKDELSELIPSGWIDNPKYILSNGDIKNLIWYKKQYGDKELNKIKVAFKFLGGYLKDEIEWGNFYNGGKELIPTLSLFLKAKTQNDKIKKWAFEELLLKSNDEDNKIIRK